MGPCPLDWIGLLHNISLLNGKECSRTTWSVNGALHEGLQWPWIFHFSQFLPCVVRNHELRLEGKGAHAYLPVQSMLESKDLHRRGRMYRICESILLGLLKNVTWLLPFIFIRPSWESGGHLINPESLLRLPAVFPALRGARWANLGLLAAWSDQKRTTFGTCIEDWRNAICQTWRSPGFHAALAGFVFMSFMSLWVKLEDPWILGDLGYLGLFWYLIHPDSQGIMPCPVNCHLGWNQLCYDLRKPHGPHPPTLASPAIQLLLGQHGAAEDCPWVRAD